MIIVGEAPGKVILSGEHAVVYGIPGIALPVIDCKAKASINFRTVAYEQPKGIIIHSPQIGEGKAEDALKPSPLELTVINFLEKYKLNPVDATIEIFSEIPIASGMGSGAAISTAIIRALSFLYKITQNNEEIFDQVFEIEKIYHGNPSGIDPKVIIYEKPFYFIKNEKMEQLEIKTKFALAIIDSEIKSSTKEVVSWLGEQKRFNPEKYNRIFNKIGEISNNLKIALNNNNNLEIIGELMNENHFYLKELGISTEILDNIVTKCRESGALGCKLSGAGWGGIVIALLKIEDIEKFKAFMKKQGIRNIKITFF